MLPNASLLSTLSPIVVYTALGLYGVLIGGVLFYVYRKFSGASMLLNSLKKDWDSAESHHLNLMALTKEHVSKLAPSPSQSFSSTIAGPRSVTFDTRNQVIAMGRKGLTASDIGRACAMPEADVDVLLGLARIQR